MAARAPLPDRRHGRGPRAPVSGGRRGVAVDAVGAGARVGADRQQQGRHQRPAAERRLRHVQRALAAGGSGDPALPLRGRVAVVTGVAEGTMGEGIAAVLLARGASVCVADHPSRAEAMLAAQAALARAAPAGARVEAVATDCSDERSVAVLFERAQAALGPVTIAVPAVGGAGVLPSGELNMESKGPNSEPVHEEAWDKTMRILQGTQLTAVLTARAAAAAMVAHGGGGSIVLIGSIMANSAAAGTAAYTISKAAVRKLR